MKKCPFYGASLVFIKLAGMTTTKPMEPSPHLVISGGNRCALITSAHSPCAMEVSGESPRWSRCPRNPEVNGTYGSLVAGGVAS